MSRLPGPFVGGGAMSTSAPHRVDWAEPYAPPSGRPSTVEEVEEETIVAGVGPGVEEVQEETAGAELGLDLEEELPAAQEETRDSDLPDSEIFSAEDVGDVMVDIDDPALAPAPLDEPEISESHVARPEDDATSVLEEPEQDIDYPDYIFGTDRTATEARPEEEEESAVQEASRAPRGRGEGLVTETEDEDLTADALARMVQRLLEDPDGPDVQQLLRKLEGLPAAEIVTRAFSAGYRAARREDEA